MTPTTEQPPPRTTTATGFRQVLRNRNFLFLWSGQWFSQLADKIFLIYMIALISAHFPADAINSMSSGIIITNSLPAILFGSLAGVYVDRWLKKTVLTVSNLLRGLFVLAVPLLPSEYTVLLAVTFAVSTLTQFFAPAETSTIPIIVEKPNLLSANSLFTLTVTGSIVIGYAIGEPLLSLFGGASNGHWVLGGFYLLAALLIGFMGNREKLQTGAAQRRSNLWKDLREGFDYLKQDADVRFAFIQLIVFYSILTALYLLAIGLAPAIGLKAEQFGYLLSAAGVGIGLGTLAIGKFAQGISRRSLALIGAVVMGLVLIALFWATSAYLMLFLVMILGIGAGCIAAPMNTLIQEQTPEHMRGKVFGLQNNATNIAQSLPLVLVERATALFGLRPVILALGLVVLLAGLLTQRLSRTPST